MALRSAVPSELAPGSEHPAESQGRRTCEPLPADRIAAERSTHGHSQGLELEDSSALTVVRQGFIASTGNRRAEAESSRLH